MHNLCSVLAQTHYFTYLHRQQGSVTSSPAIHYFSFKKTILLYKSFELIKPKLHNSVYKGHTDRHCKNIHTYTLLIFNF